MRVSAPRGPALKEKVHETCGQDVDPDGRFGLHVCRGRYPNVRSSGWWSDPVQSKDGLPQIRQLYRSELLAARMRPRDPVGLTVANAMSAHFFVRIADTARQLCD